jgi:hypothetical protein
LLQPIYGSLRRDEVSEDAILIIIDVLLQHLSLHLHHADTLRVESLDGRHDLLLMHRIGTPSARQQPASLRDLAIN